MSLNIVNSFKFGAVGGWIELGRTTLGSPGDTINVAGLPNKRYYKVLVSGLSTGSNLDVVSRYNNDAANNYAFRFSDNGGGDGTGVNQLFSLFGTNGGPVPQFAVKYITNLSDQEKLSIEHGVDEGGVGAGIPPARREGASKWNNVVDSINAINAFNNVAGDFDTNSEVVVLGWDPDDTHTDNFWEEIGDETLGIAGDSLPVTIPARKYLWVQVYAINSGDISPRFQFNDDTANNYSTRGSRNGEAEITNTDINTWVASASTATSPVFWNLFFVNISNQEKLAIGNTNTQEAAGASTAPSRDEIVYKWSNSSAQITKIDLTNFGAGDFAAGTRIKVWGHD